MIANKLLSSRAWIRGVIVLLVVSPFGSAFAAAEAGKVVNVAGRAAAATQQGDIRSLGRGEAVNSGETVVTSSNSYVRMKFIDGASVILRPNSRFHIEEYQVAEKEEENRSFFSLVKGGFRAVTGAIGRRNRSGYRVRTAVATIGIRGTDYSMRTCAGDCGNNPDGDYYQVHEGGIFVSTDGGGQSDYQAGDFAYVQDPSMTPISIPEADADPLTDDPLPPAACE
tara:strand:+ start:1758 stop:2432 length:675 start_codon:yes stop_codon:yes gene_type:complete